MAAPSVPAPAPPPRPPAYAWDWLQRSRPVVDRLARVLTGRAPRPGFVQAVRRSFAQDPLVRDAVLGVIAETAFRGRVPAARPRGAVWDRGLVWWAATLVGRTPTEYEADPEPVDQPELFDGDAAAPLGPAEVAAELRGLLATATDGRVAAAAVRRLLDRLER